MTLDALDHYVEGVQKIVAVVYVVHLARTQQFRNHVPLYHLRKPLDAGHLIEVRIGPSSTWKPGGDQEEPAGEHALFLPAGSGGQ